MRVLALDLARLTGWAVGTFAGVEAFGTHELPSAGIVGMGEYGSLARASFRRMFGLLKPDVVVFEQPILRSGKIKNRGGKQFVQSIDTPEKLRKIYGLSFELAVECFEHGLPCSEANIATVRAHFLMGKTPKTSEECKLHVKVMARKRGWEIRDDNEADALAILDWKLAKLQPTKWLALKINAGPSDRMSSSGADAFAKSSGFSLPATPTDEARKSSSPTAGAGVALNTTQKSSGRTTATIRASDAGMSSTL